MKQPKVYGEHTFCMDNFIYTGGPMTGKSEVAFLNEASNQGIKYFLGDSVYEVTGKSVPGISTTSIYGEIIPKDGSDSFREFCGENIDIIAHCIRDEKIIFPFLDYNISGVYTISLCGKELCNRIVAHEEITKYVDAASDVFRFNRCVFSPGKRGDTKYISMEAICDDIVVDARDSKVGSAIMVNLAAQIRHEILQNIYVRCGHSTSTMQIYNLVDSLLVTLRQMVDPSGCGALNVTLSNKAEDAIAKIMTDCTAVRFVDEYITRAAACEYSDYAILEAEKITSETLDTVGKLFSECGKAFPSKAAAMITTEKEPAKAKSETKVTKKKATTTATGTKGKKSTTKSKITKEKVVKEAKNTTSKMEGENENGKEEK